MAKQSKKQRNPLRPAWTPLKRTLVNPALDAIGEGWEWAYINDTYQVLYRTVKDTPEGWPDIVHLSIKRHDRKHVHDWRDFQRIKNEVCGPELEAVELYPAESRLMDTSNQYHLWVFPEGYRLPFGYCGRVVMDGTGGRAPDGSRQRPFRKDERPDDLISPEEGQAMAAKFKADRGVK